MLTEPAENGEKQPFPTRAAVPCTQKEEPSRE